MTGRLLDFFTLEADEYVEQLDALVSRATSAAVAVLPNPVGATNIGARAPLA
jgi:hypothetical protein